MLLEAFQPTLDEGVPLSAVDFCVVDLETTGGSPTDAGITEIGAVRYRGGERLGTFDTLVNPMRPIPRFVAHLTGIDDRMVRDAPTIEQVLPSFVEFARGAVLVAHNAPFDVGFLNAALIALDREPFTDPPICTAKLARRVVWPDVPNVKLATLARYFRTPTQPSHRAVADAQACAEVLHGLIELGGRLGISTLGDLRLATRAHGRPNYGKIRLADDLPRSPGVYLFRGREDQVLYVGKSRDIRTRVRTYFYGDGRKKIENLLAETTAVEGRPCGSELEALALEARLIREHEPKYNRHGRTWRRYAYLKLDLAEVYPRLKVVREVRGEGAFLGPFASSGRAHLAKEALEEAFPIRRCTRAMGPRTRFSPCALAEMGRCLAPCDGRVDADAYADLARALRDALDAPGGLLATLEARMRDLAAAERFEEAAGGGGGPRRPRGRPPPPPPPPAAARPRSRQDAWVVGGTFRVVDRDGREVAVEGGRLGGAGDPIPLPCPRERTDELAVVRRFLARSRPTNVDAEVAPSEPVDGGAALHRLIGALRAADAED
ncbi:MAG: DEDD exonuclease domain-containing protein [Actinomycetota bacterium]